MLLRGPILCQKYGVTIVEIQTWECLSRIKVRQLTIKQWKELMEDLNTLKNVENLQQHKPEDTDLSDNRYELLKQDFT